MRRGMIALVAVLVLAVAGLGVWFFLLRSDAPPPVALDDAVESLTTTSGASAAATTEPVTEVTTSAPPATTTQAPDTTAAAVAAGGEWAIDQTNSFVGYRVQEELANFGFTEAVGRTSEITGSLMLEDMAVTSVVVDVDVTTLQSDRSQRDRAMRSQGLETDAFPAAGFVSTQPIMLNSEPADGDQVAASVVGELTIHGVTNSVEIPVEGQVVGDSVVVVGSLPVAFADYQIQTPSSFAVLSVEDNGVLELQLTFVPA